MQHLEDFLELAGDLQSEVTNKLNEIESLDKKAEILKFKSMQKKEKTFKSLAMNEGNENEHQKTLDGINEDMMQIVEIHRKTKEIADNMENLITRYMRKLDSNILQRKLELEEDNPGVTEVIENRVNNPKPPPLQQVPEKNYQKKTNVKRRLPVKKKQKSMPVYTDILYVKT